MTLKAILNLSENLLPISKEKKIRRPRAIKAVARACDFCQRRKIRCIPNINNKCEACIKKVIPCTYENPTKRNIKLNFRKYSESSESSFHLGLSPSPGLDNPYNEPLILVKPEILSPETLLTPREQYDDTITSTPDQSNPIYNWPQDLNSCYSIPYYQVYYDDPLKFPPLMKKIYTSKYLTEQHKLLLLNFHHFVSSELHKVTTLKFYNKILKSTTGTNTTKINKLALEWYLYCVSATLGFYIALGRTSLFKLELNLISEITPCLDTIAAYSDAVHFILSVDKEWDMDVVKCCYHLLGLCHQWAGCYILN